MKISSSLLHLLAVVVVILAGIGVLVVSSDYNYQASRNLAWPLAISGLIVALVLYALGDGLDLLAEIAANSTLNRAANQRTAAALEQLAARGRKPNPQQTSRIKKIRE